MTLHVDLTGPVGSQGRYRILDLLGRVRSVGVITADARNLTLSLPAGISQGSYMLEMEGGGRRVLQPFHVIR